MAAKPKLSPDQWADVRAHWERDPRDGYAWLVEELTLPVSAPAVRKMALRDGWAKGDAAGTAPVPAKKKEKARGATAPKADDAAQDRASARKERGKDTGKVSSKVSKVFENHHAKVSETMSETMRGRETMPLTTAEAVERDPDQFGVFAQLTDMQEVFVREYMTDWNGTQAAIRAGYSAKSAHILAWELLKNPKVREAIELLASARARRLGIDAEELMRMWAAVVNLDANEISQLRRVCCPFCWGEGHARQYTPSGLEEARKGHERERERRRRRDANDDIGVFPEYVGAWYDKRRPPAEDCPECHGQGLEEVFFNDTRNLSPAARLVYCGVKVGKEGIEVLTLSKEKAMDNFGRALGLFKDKEAEVNINLVSSDDLYRVYDEKMQQARARQAAVLAERGLTVDADDADTDAVPALGAGDDEQEEG